MTINNLLVFSALLIAAILAEPVARRLRVPFAAVLIAVGFVGSEVIVALGYDTGLRWYHFHDLILHVFLPVLVFASAFNLKAKTVLKDLLPILFLAVPVMLAVTLLSGGLIFLGIGHPGFPILAALLAGALLSATDPVSVVALFQRIGAPERLTVLMEGESLFNDATAIVLFTLLLSLALMPAQDVDAAAAAGRFLTVFAGGLLSGLVVGAGGLLLPRVCIGPVTRALATLISALISVQLAEHWLQVSGVVSVLVTGLMLGEANRRRGDSEFSAELWALNAYVANALIFLLMGVTITVAMFTQQWLAMLIGVGAALATRAIAVFVLLPPINRLPTVEPIPSAYWPVLYWGGLRGAVTLALALALPLELEPWWTIQSIAYGVVLFTLFVQAPTMGLLLRRLGLVAKSLK